MVGRHLRRGPHGLQLKPEVLATADLDVAKLQVLYK